MYTVTVTFFMITYPKNIKNIIVSIKKTIEAETPIKPTISRAYSSPGLYCNDECNNHVQHNNYYKTTILLRQ